MNVIDQLSPAAAAIPGIRHATWAGQAEGLSQLSVWRQALAPGVHARALASLDPGRAG